MSPWRSFLTRSRRSTVLSARRAPIGPRLEVERLEDRLVFSVRPLASPPVAAGPDEPVQHLAHTYYLIPSNREPQPGAILALQYNVLWAQYYYLEQMDRNGFGPKTFLYETEDDGFTPRIHVVYAPEPDSYFRDDPWGRVNPAARAAGIPLFQPGQVWFGFFEGHLMNPDSSVVGGYAGGASFGSGSDGGVALLGSNGLVLRNIEDLFDDQPYAGQVRPALGPYPMIQDVTFPWFSGRTISSVSSSQHGAALHELGHAFGLPHDFRNDANAYGNLMGNGLRGFRGWLVPYLYPDDDVHLAYGSALALNSSRYFNWWLPFTDTVRPTLTVHTSGTVAPVNGLLPIRFTAADVNGLSAAFLQLGGDRVAEVPLSGTSADVTFTTAYYTPGQVNNYTVTVLDAEGNRQNVATTITPATGLNRAPRPYLKVGPSQTYTDGWVLLDASRSTDPDHPAATLQVEWDLDGDGIYDTQPTTEKTLWMTYSAPGTVLVRCRITDPAGAQAESAPVPIRVSPWSGPGAPGGGSSPGSVTAPGDVVFALVGAAHISANWNGSAIAPNQPAANFHPEAGSAAAATDLFDGVGRFPQKESLEIRSGAQSGLKAEWLPECEQAFCSDLPVVLLLKPKK